VCTDVAANRPLAEDRDTVWLRRSDYEALLQHAEDTAQIREVEARVAAGQAAWMSVIRGGMMRSYSGRSMRSRISLSSRAQRRLCAR
jgi:hypothetical protein